MFVRLCLALLLVSLPDTLTYSECVPLLEALLLDKYGAPTYFTQHRCTVRMRCSYGYGCPTGALMQLIGADGRPVAERTLTAHGRTLSYSLVIDDDRLAAAAAAAEGSYACRLWTGGQFHLNTTSEAAFSTWPRFCADAQTARDQVDPGSCGDKFSAHCTLARQGVTARHCDHLRHQWCAHLRKLQPLQQRWTACMTAVVDDGRGPLVETAAPTACHAIAIGRDVHFEVAEGYQCSAANHLHVSVLDQSRGAAPHWRRTSLGTFQALEQNAHGRLLVLVGWSSWTGTGAVVDCDLLKEGGHVMDSFRLRGPSPQVANFSHDGGSTKVGQIVCYLFANKAAAAGRTVAIARAQSLVLLWDVQTEIWPPLVNCAALYLLRCRFVKPSSAKQVTTRIVWMLEQRVLAESASGYVDTFARTAGRYTCIGMQDFRTFNPPGSFSQSATSYVDVPAGCLSGSASAAKVSSLVARSSLQLLRDEQTTARWKYVNLLLSHQFDNQSLSTVPLLVSLQRGRPN